MIEFEEYKVKLNSLKPTLDSLRDALHLEAAEKEIEELEGQSARDGFWNDVENSQRVQKRLKQLKGKTENYQKLCAQWDDLMTLCEMAIEENDDSMLPELQSDFAAFEKKLEETRLGTLLTGEYDANNAILTFHAGAGGTEARTGRRCFTVCTICGPSATATPSSSWTISTATRPASRARPS